MPNSSQKYCLDANVLIQAWQKYYSPSFCPSYWDVLDKLGSEGRIFLPQLVYDEITRTEDDLSRWLKASKIPKRILDVQITECWKDILAVNPIHKNLVDNNRNRSLADPWVIAHALRENACVVTKEEKITAPNSTKIKIPNVCSNIGLRCMNDFEFILEMNLKFNCQLY